MLLLSLSDFRRALEAGQVDAAYKSPWDDYSARSFVRQHFRGSFELMALRRALANDHLLVYSMCDDDIVAAAALRLRSGVWAVAYRRPPPAVIMVGAPPSASSVAAAEAPASAQQIRELRPVASRTPAATAAPLVESEWPEQTDQVSFAAVLEQAAQNATPFCEICARALAQKASSR